MNRCEQFIKERMYIVNVTDRTIEWHQNSLRYLPNDAPTDSELKAMVIAMRERGLSPASCNAVARSVNAYLKWSGSALRVPKMREPQRVMDTYTPEQIKRFINCRAQCRNQRRAQVLNLVMLDTGARLSEVLMLRVNGIDVDNCLVTLDGKGRKQRIVPFSFELRRVMFKWIQAEGLKSDDLLIGTRDGVAMSRRNALRDVKQLCKTLGFAPPRRTCHAARHTMALNYVKRGGSVFHLQKQLGHASLEMSRRYCNLATADLQEVHQRLSVLK